LSNASSSASAAPAEVVEAELTWTGERFERGVQIAIDDDGRISAVGELGLPAGRRLPGRALLPGLVNAHSHAFQRAMRGRGETFPEGSGCFWSWREGMVELVGRLDPAHFHDLYAAAFREMRAAGITTVGEFHYLHHTTPEAEDFALDEHVLAAAEEVGIRLVLLEAYYASGGIGQPLTGPLRRLRGADPASYWRQMDRLARQLASRRQSLGAVAHSIRAATPGEMAELYGEARRRGLVFHLHLEEQQREIDDTVAAYGQRPMALLLEALPSCEGVTAVHCTHTAPAEMARYLDAGGRVCICPLTEGNLGDGIADLPAIHRAARGRLSLGTDSNARISMLEEMRWLEYVQRLERRQRGVLHDAGGSGARPLLRAATEDGATTLGVAAGRIAAGCWADLLVVDLAATTLAGWDDDNLLPALVFGTAEEVVAATCVAGAWQEHRSPGLG
jgi:formimidoylglutamate deiminase